MKAAIIAVGDEVLLGETVNTNASYLSRMLDEQGIEVAYHKTVGDVEQAICDAIGEACSKADIIVCSGGLGPTMDDMTKQAVANALGLKLVYDAALEEEMAARFRARNASFTPNNLSQCYLPEGSEALKNRNGTAPGVYLEHGRKTIIMLPGPPRELNPMFEEFALPKIKSKAHKASAVKYYMASGIGESYLESLLREAIPPNDEYYHVNTYLTDSGIMVKAVAFDSSERSAAESISFYDDAVKEAIGSHLYSERKIDLWDVAAGMLIEQDLSISFAESYTGGMLSEQICRKEGISAVFKGSVVAYSNEAKINLLGVPKEIIEEHGAVSAQAAVAMAEGAARIFNSDIAISTTGVAGPGPSEGKSPGTCYSAMFFRGNTVCEENLLVGARNTMRARGATNALFSLFSALKFRNEENK
ncbi:MAG: competence/damage-inducible protein A [Eubacteriaceae bacterium]|nr:competence/damage-inducible protein A [Eubacteriaceae bacterium]